MQSSPHPTYVLRTRLFSALLLQEAWNQNIINVSKVVPFFPLRVWVCVCLAPKVVEKESRNGNCPSRRIESSKLSVWKNCLSVKIFRPYLEPVLQTFPLILQSVRKKFPNLSASEKNNLPALVQKTRRARLSLIHVQSKRASVKVTAAVFPCAGLSLLENFWCI